eukprot:TRINITY_DN11625_c0_g1_i1.p3 TRINITY_DN11625_c0_g1~~TRINITY_DN11625_c0_g1_i1.p3  ORF type:complete len:221 (+),score=30.31 TRINITY_DN11625_c0_g1_i1:2739-3401(+)
MARRLTRDFTSQKRWELNEACEELAKPSCTTSTMSFNGVRMSTSDVTRLGGALLQNDSLRTLELMNANLQPDAIIAFISILKIRSKLETLSLYHNNCDDRAADTIAGWLATDKTIQTLDLGKNKIGAEGASALAEVLPTSSLTILRMEHNPLPSEALVELGCAFKASRLQTLDLQSSRTVITDEANATLQRLQREALPRRRLSYDPSGHQMLRTRMRMGF